MLQMAVPAMELVGESNRGVGATMVTVMGIQDMQMKPGGLILHKPLASSLLSVVEGWKYARSKSWEWLDCFNPVVFCTCFLLICQANFRVVLQSSHSEHVFWVHASRSISRISGA
ncbi:hypothetical protein NC652_007660 [Populus alba x Populus x berolinensis]|nr:hypothetical protein NC652_007660 [Populus alba x Populus x berolinensis]